MDAALPCADFFHIKPAFLMRSISWMKPKSASFARPLTEQFAAPLHLEDCTEVAFLALGASLRISAKLIWLQISKTPTKATFKLLRSTVQIGPFKENITGVSYPLFQPPNSPKLWDPGAIGWLRSSTCPIATTRSCSHLPGSIMEVPGKPSPCCLSWVTKDVCGCWFFLLSNVMCFLMTQPLIIT